MILLSENKDYQYWAAEVPKNAYDFEINKDSLHWKGDKWNGYDLYVITGMQYHDFELIGVMGNGLEISEKVAGDILGDDKCKAGLNDIFLLKFRIKEKGIQIENPIPKPEEEKYGYVSSNSFDEESGWCLEGGEEAYYEALKEWQYSENKVVKLVIIKVKK